MKKILSLLVATLCCFSTYSQEAEPVGNIPELTIIPRFDVNPHIPVGNNGKGGVDFANTSLYTLFQGNIGDNFSYSVSNHWLSTSPRTLYDNTLRSDDVSWLDWLTLTYSTDCGLAFTLGKDVMQVGGFEIDAYDVDSHIDLSSMIWNNLPVYQWGGKIAYTVPSESSTITAQFTTSPFAARPFSGKLFAYSLGWRSEFDWYSSIWSASFIEYERGRFMSVLSLGNRFDIGDFYIELDYMNRAISAKRYFNQEMSLVCRAGYNLGDKAEFFIKGGYEYRHGADDMTGDGDDWEFGNGIVPTGIMCNKDYVFYGAGIHFYPLRESKALRLHAVVAANNYAKHVALTVGASYWFNLADTIRKCRNK